LRHISNSFCRPRLFESYKHSPERRVFHFLLRLHRKGHCPSTSSDASHIAHPPYPVSGSQIHPPEDEAHHVIAQHCTRGPSRRNFWLYNSHTHTMHTGCNKYGSPPAVSCRRTPCCSGIDTRYPLRFVDIQESQISTRGNPHRREGHCTGSRDRKQGFEATGKGCQCR
jgi:hypothetical protein